MKRQYGLIIVKVILVLILAGAGVLKLTGMPEVHQSFQILGLPGWFGYFIGVCEVLASVAFFIRPLSSLAAGGSAMILLGAIYYHLMYTPIVDAATAVIGLALCLYVFNKDKARMFKFGIQAS